MAQRSITNESICGQTIVLTGPLTEEQLFLIIEEIQEVRDSRAIRRFLEEVWGDLDGAESFIFAATESPDEEARPSLTVFDAQNRLLLPNLRLPFWQAYLGDVHCPLKKELEQCASDEARLEVLNHFLSIKSILKEYVLPDPRSERLTFQHKTLLGTLSVTYPALYELDHVQMWERARHDGQPLAKDELANDAVVLSI